MSIEAIKQDLLAAIARAMDEAIERAFAEGEQRAAHKVWSAVAAALPATAGLSRPDDAATDEHGAEPLADTSGAVEVADKAKRAPKGLTDIILRQVLSTGIGLPMEEVQRRAVALDSRISPKTVYNSLYRGPDYAQDTRGHWRLRALAEQLVLTNAPEERENQEAPTAH
jgi:hypothetical protein